MLFAPKTILSLFITLFFFTKAFPQERLPYFLNTNNGLPSNHVYYSLKDQKGYLWIATNKGVAKYNGYQLSIFDFESGISNDDVWYIFEDSKERIWLSTISRELGYVYQDQYHKIFTKEQNNILFYPLYYQDLGNGIAFVNVGTEKADKIFLVRNDSLSSYNLYSKIYLEPHKAVLQNGRNITLVEPGKKIIQKKIPSFLANNYTRLFNTYFIPVPFTSDGKTPMHIYNLVTSKVTDIVFPKNEKIFTHYIINDNCYLTSNKHIYKLSPTLTITTIPIIDSLLSKKTLKENDILTYRKDSLWGEITCTATNGILFSFPKYKLHKISEQIISGIKYLNTINHTRYFFDKYNMKLICENKNQSHKISVDPGYAIHSVINYKNDSILLLTNHGIEWLKKNTTITYNNKDNKTNIQDYSTNGIVTNDSEIVYLASGYLVKKTLTNTDSQVVTLAKERFDDVLYDHDTKILIAYSRNNILIIKNGKKTQFSMSDTHPIFNIEKISLIKSHDLLLVKSNRKLLALNLKHPEIKELFTNINTANAFCFSNDDKIVLVGKLGVASINMLPSFKFSSISILPNIKNTNYNYLFEAYMNSDDSSLILNSDRGIYKVALYNKLLRPNGSFDTLQYRLVISNSNKLFTWKKGLSLNIGPKDPILILDFINPIGTGKVNYEYKIDNSLNGWEVLNANRISLANLTPGVKYDLFIRVNDEIITTRSLKITLHIIPYWWQTIAGKCTLGLSMIGLIFITALISSNYARKRTLRKKEKESLELEVKNLNLALELKSIYSQINPHFIFNTINTGLYFIKKGKMEKAYAHITSFSKLLRSYLSSSRNKYINLKDEIENLEHYISLQQARFDDHFNYKIIVEKHLLNHRILLPSLLLQPIVENAIQHGLLPLKRVGNLTIKFEQNKNDSLICSIDDDGIGRAVSKSRKKSTNIKTSYGNELINELIDTFNRYEKIKIELHYIDKVLPKTGTTVIIYIHNLT